MMNIIKNFIKTKPKIYDFINSRRKINDPVELWLDEFSRKNHKKISFIQVGANDGLRWDPIRRFIIRDSWKGILIEPITPVFKMLQSNYAYKNNGRLFFENCVISSEKSDGITFWSYSEKFLDSLPLEDKLFYLRKSSMDKKQVERTLSTKVNIEEVIVAYKVRCRTLSEIIDLYYKDNKVDLIFIDAEGHDDQVIRTIDFEKSKPKAILYESHNLGDRSIATEEHLEERGYKIRRLGGDTVAELRN